MRAALFQGPELSFDVAANLAAIASAAQTAAAAGASILVCPEMVSHRLQHRIPGRGARRTRRRTDRGADRGDRTRVRDRHRLRIPRGATGASSTTACRCSTASGTSLANYRKTHLFGELDRSHFAAGDELVVQFDLAGIRCGLLICYDVEFPGSRSRTCRPPEPSGCVVPTGLMSPYEFIAEQRRPHPGLREPAVCHVRQPVRHRSRPRLLRIQSVRSRPTAPNSPAPAATKSWLIVDLELDVLRRSRRENTHLDDRRVDLYPFMQEKTS